MVSARPKFWDCPMKKAYPKKIIIFGHVTLKKCQFGRFCRKSAHLGTVSARVKLIGITKGKKRIWLKNNIFDHVILKKSWFGSFGGKNSYLRNFSARAKRTKFWDHSRKKTYLTEKLNFSHVTLKKCWFGCVYRKSANLRNCKWWSGTVPKSGLSLVSEDTCL